jgi:hypothetical protein
MRDIAEPKLSASLEGIARTANGFLLDLKIRRNLAKAFHRSDLADARNRTDAR